MPKTLEQKKAQLAELKAGGKRKMKADHRERARAAAQKIREKRAIRGAIKGGGRENRVKRLELSIEIDEMVKALDEYKAQHGLKPKKRSGGKRGGGGFLRSLGLA